MINAYLMVGGIAVVAWIIVLLDWLGRRNARRAREAEPPYRPNRPISS
jgi:hypothetical protein